MSKQRRKRGRKQVYPRRGGGGGGDTLCRLLDNITVITCIDIKKYGGITSMGSQNCK